MSSAPPSLPPQAVPHPHLGVVLQGLVLICYPSIHFLLTTLYCGAGIDLVAIDTGPWKASVSENVVFNVTVKVCVCIKRYVAKIGPEIDTEVEQGHPFKSCLQDCPTFLSYLFYGNTKTSEEEMEVRNKVIKQIHIWERPCYQYAENQERSRFFLQFDALDRKTAGRGCFCWPK